MRKPTIFIGSSTEGKRIAEEIQLLVEDVAEVKIWDQETFFLGEHALESLRREVLQTDFALLIVTPDDEIQRRNKKGYTARDNILFELGLFMGALGPSRSFYLVIDDKRSEELRRVILPSDLSGIIRLQVTLDKDRSVSLSLRSVSTQLKKAIERNLDSISVTLLPSTSLAIGYFHNFILQVCRKLYSIKNFSIGDGVFDLSSDQFDFHIVLPNCGSDASHEGFLKFVRLKKLERIEIEGDTKARRFPFFVDSTIKEGRVAMFDYPTTLRAAREAILIAAPRNVTEQEIEILERREISNFENTLKKLLKEPTAADFRDNIKILSLSDLS